MVYLYPLSILAQEGTLPTNSHTGRPQRLDPDGGASDLARAVRLVRAVDQRHIRVAGVHHHGQHRVVQAFEARRGLQEHAEYRQEGHEVQRHHAQNEGRSRAVYRRGGRRRDEG